MNSWNSSGSVAAKNVMKCVERHENDVQILDAVRNIVISTESLAFASEITSRLLSNDYMIQLPKEEKEAVKSIMIKRLHEEVLKSKQNIFATYPTSYYRILSPWRSDQILGEKDVVTNYVYEQLPRDTSVLPKILLNNATFNIPTYTIHSFEFERLESEYDIDLLFSILQEQEAAASYSQIEQEVITAFKSFMIKRNDRANKLIL